MRFDDWTDDDLIALYERVTDHQAREDLDSRALYELADDVRDVLEARTVERAAAMVSHWSRPEVSVKVLREAAGVVEPMEVRQ